jgi:hypothetical protein
MEDGQNLEWKSEWRIDMTGMEYVAYGGILEWADSATEDLQVWMAWSMGKERYKYSIAFLYAMITS